MYDERNYTPPINRTFKGQRYVCLGIVPHLRKDGVLSALNVWVTHCATCDRLFVFRAPVHTDAYNRRCERHHRIGYPVARERRAQKVKEKTHDLTGVH
jgi:hypothetical protein